MLDRQKIIILAFALVGVIIITSFTIYKLSRENTELRNSLPYFLPGESIEYFDLLDRDGNKINASNLETQRISLIFIFSRPCSKCNKNLVFWNKIAQLFKDKANIYGIVVDNPSAAFSFAEKSDLKFKIFIPWNIGEFIKRMRLKLNLSQTIIYRDDVIYVHSGIMDAQKAINIIKQLKELTKNKMGEK